MPSRAFWAACLRILAAALGVFLFVRFLLPVLLPFLIGLLVALLAQRPIALCTNRLHAPRTLAAFFCTLLLFALLGSALFFLGRVLFGELSGFLREIPSLLSSISVPLASIKLRLYALAGRLPDGLGTGLRASLDQFFQSSGAFGARAYEWLFHQASRFLSHLPGVVLFAVAAIVSSFMLAAQLPQLRRSFAAHLPQLARGKLASALGHIRAALGGNVTLYDGSDGTARETLRQLVRRGWVRGGSHGAVTLENSLPSELPLSRRLLALPRED